MLFEEAIEVLDGVVAKRRGDGADLVSGLSDLLYQRDC
jgi:hypothetical protein